MHFPPFKIVAVLAILGVLGFGRALPAAEPEKLDVPVLDGDWWQIAADSPDVSPFQAAPGQTANLCDFTIFKDARGTWHLIACVRGTTAPGQRVFHHWTSPSLSAKNWVSAGNFDAPRGSVMGKPDSEQAPHAFKAGDRYYLFYNSAGFARALTSPDGAEWKDASGEWNVFHNDKGNAELFKMGRDVFLFRDTPRNRWMAFYCANYPAGMPHTNAGFMAARTAPALEGPWSPDQLSVRTEGNPESPFVVEHGGKYYLWEQMDVYQADTPEKFEGKPVQNMTGLWFGGKYAPEIVEENGQWYIAGYNRGIHIARFHWVAKSLPEIEEWRSTKFAELEREREKRDPSRKPASTGTPAPSAPVSAR